MNYEYTYSEVEESGVLSGLITRGSVVQIHPSLYFFILD